MRPSMKRLRHKFWRPGGMLLSSNLPSLSVVLTRAVRPIETLMPTKGLLLSSKTWPVKLAGPSWAALAWMR